MNLLEINSSLSLHIKFKFKKKKKQTQTDHPLKKKKKAKTHHQINHQLSYKVISIYSAENAATTVLTPGQFCPRTRRNATHQGCQYTCLMAHCGCTHGCIWVSSDSFWSQKAGKPSACSLLPLVPRCTPVWKEKFTNTKCGPIRASLKCTQCCFETPSINAGHWNPDLHAAVPACSTPEQLIYSRHCVVPKYQTFTKIICKHTMW